MIFNEKTSDVLLHIFSFLYYCPYSNNEAKEGAIVTNVRDLVEDHNEMVKIQESFPEWRSLIVDQFAIPMLVFQPQSPFSTKLRVMDAKEVAIYACSGRPAAAPRHREVAQNIFLDGSEDWNQWYDSATRLPGHVEVVSRQTVRVVGYAITSAGNEPECDPKDWSIMLYSGARRKKYGPQNSARANTPSGQIVHVRTGCPKNHKPTIVHQVTNHVFAQRHETHAFALPLYGESLVGAKIDVAAGNNSAKSTTSIEEDRLNLLSTKHFKLVIDKCHCPHTSKGKQIAQLYVIVEDASQLEV